VSAKNRRPARIIALQALYELDLTRHSLAEVVAARIDEQPAMDDEVRAFAYALVNGTLDNHHRLDALIRQYAPEWPLDQMAVIDRNILRLAIYEFAVGDLTPVKVAINEAIELAKDYGSESTSRFVNGVLGALAGQLADGEGSSVSSKNGKIP
jgi:N utilization substance protein B